jgi:hypothetical protein
LSNLDKSESESDSDNGNTSDNPTGYNSPELAGDQSKDSDRDDPGDKDYNPNSDCNRSKNDDNYDKGITGVKDAGITTGPVPSNKENETPQQDDPNKNGKPVLYVELKKALYRTMRAALLSWKLLTSKLVAMGFVINPYGWCVANKTINNKQCTILWHIDDLKILHVDQNVVTEIIKQLQVEFGKEAPLTVMRRKSHDYLGMTIDYRISGKVQIKMIDKIENMLSKLPADMDGESVSPAPNHLFKVNTEKPEMLDRSQSEIFHHSVAKLFASRPGQICKRL